MTSHLGHQQLSLSLVFTHRRKALVEIAHIVS